MPPLLVLSFNFDYSLQTIAIWTCLALLALLILLRQPATLTLASDEKGQLSISRHALNRLVEACCEQLNGVATARAQVTRQGGRFHTQVRLKVRPNAKLDAIQGYLTQEIANVYRDNLGLNDIGPINVKVVGVVGGNSGF